MSVPPGCTPSALFNLKKDGRPKSPGTASARCTSRFWWCDPQLWPRWTSSSWMTWTVTMSTWRPACALAVRNRLCLLHVLQRRERIWVESKNVPASFSAISCFVQSLKIRGVSQLKISLAGLFWVFTLVDFTSFLFGQFLLVLCVLCKISSKQFFFCCSVHETLVPDSWVLLGVVNLIFATYQDFPPTEGATKFSKITEICCLKLQGTSLSFGLRLQSLGFNGWSEIRSKVGGEVGFPLAIM